MQQAFNPSKLLAALSERDKVTYDHSLHMGILLKDFSLYLGYSEREAEELYLAGLLHDIGKLEIPLKILCKPGRLTLEEMEVMKKHTVFGSEILKSLGASEIVCKIAEGHHLSFSGEGYPFTSIKGESISEYCRMASIVDVYEALTAKRPYKDGIKTEEALKIMNEASNLDPVLHEKFKKFIVNF